MMNLEGKIWFQKLQKKWIIFTVISLALIAISVAAVLSTLGFWLLHWSIAPAFTIAFIIIFSPLLLLNKSLRITIDKLAVMVNQQYPQVEESSQLVLQPIEKLGFLQRLQAQKVSEILVNLPQPNQPQKQLKGAFLLLFAGLIFAFGISQLKTINKNSEDVEPVTLQISQVKDIIPAQVSMVEVQIIAPAYTGLKKVVQKQFSIKVVAGAKVFWKVETTTSAKAIKFIFNEQESIGLKPENDTQTLWTSSRTFTKPGFYQIEIDGKKSELYQVEVIEDQPVNIKIIRPEQQTVIDFGQAKKVNLQVLLSDDFGITEAFINATTASGKGEAVSFKERKIVFNQGISGREMNLSKVLDLNALGMQAGDELYFYILAKDNHGQESRSDIYIVSITDTTELMSMNGMMGGVNLVPEYFRSQRQIIIDTEKLLREQASISADEFKNRSNNLGIDQKLLRLRYGKFLGEESETTIGEVPGGDEHHDDDGHDHGKTEEKKFGDVSAIMDEYAHKHDNSEDATFFEPDQKNKLKATLTEMWNSELRLRTYRPQEALPFEYKALRLLKDLQQSSRAYVAKTAVKTTPLKSEKRLTGELDKILSPVNQQKETNKNERQKALKAAITVLENLKQGKALAFAERKTLSNARVYVVQAAAQNPKVYLTGLTLMNKINAEDLNAKNIDFSKVQFVLQQLLEKEEMLPQASMGIVNSSLGKAYFQNLKSGQ
jgi:hypothetical protein